MKRIFDIVVAILALLILAPFFVLVCFLVAIKLGRPIFFKQTRPGLDGMLFQMVKFRSMTDATDSDGNLLSDEQRLTSFGKLLRSSSLDELPELLNVIKGDMSLVGPRPLLPSYLPLYSEQQQRRHEVRPGITGWAQVNGRNALGWEEKFELDVWYVDNRSFLLDIKILFMTVFKVIRRDGISDGDSVTMAPFTGSKSSD